MLDPSNRFRPTPDGVVAEVLDGEAIIINLVAGAYYSMDQVGALAWSMLDSGRTVGEIVTAVVGQYDVSPEQALSHLTQLLQELLEEGLVVSVDEPAEPPANPVLPSATDKLPYVQPRLHIFREMAELLALDPPMPSLQDIPWSGSSTSHHV